MPVTDGYKRFLGVIGEKAPQFPKDNRINIQSWSSFLRLWEVYFSGDGFNEVHRDDWDFVVTWTNIIRVVKDWPGHDTHGRNLANRVMRYHDPSQSPAYWFCDDSVEAMEFRDQLFRFFVLTLLRANPDHWKTYPNWSTLKEMENVSPGIDLCSKWRYFYQRTGRLPIEERITRVIEERTTRVVDHDIDDVEEMLMELSYDRASHGV